MSESQGEDPLVVATRANHEIFMLTSSRLEAFLARHRLTYQTAQALWVIDPDEPAPSMKVMADRLYCNAPNLSFIARQLADRGYLERVVDPDDRRSRVLVLTDEGRRVRAAVIDATLSASPFAQCEPHELRELAAALERLRRRAS
ncbi:MarR family winged helix-turn-helix transcriptional regulator [Marinactinospora rubrisoli]|uniref:MarR family winged helix-turn-helix transcriptional regulator n=1 Tax=Marinactinospora rubrisoli TaxID=2715399 RepID=A0ABW2KMW0_9ACTN